MYLDEALWRRVQERAAEQGQDPREVIEDAVRRYLDDVWEMVWRTNRDPLPENEALRLAYRELGAVRQRRNTSS